VDGSWEVVMGDFMSMRIDDRDLDEPWFVVVLSLLGR